MAKMKYRKRTLTSTMIIALSYSYFAAPLKARYTRSFKLPKRREPLISTQFSGIIRSVRYTATWLANYESRIKETISHQLDLKVILPSSYTIERFCAKLSSDERQCRQPFSQVSDVPKSKDVSQ